MSVEHLPVNHMALPQQRDLAVLVSHVQWDIAIHIKRRPI